MTNDHLIEFDAAGWYAAMVHPAACWFPHRPLSSCPVAVAAQERDPGYTGPAAHYCGLIPPEYCVIPTTGLLMPAADPVLGLFAVDLEPAINPPEPSPLRGAPARVVVAIEGVGAQVVEGTVHRAGGVTLVLDERGRDERGRQHRVALVLPGFDWGPAGG